MTHVWYVAYGSNLSLDRLACYVAGGRPPGGTRSHPGARDRTLPERSVPVELPGTTYFAGRSAQWGGGVAYYDHATPGRTAARGYLVTAGQFADIAAQEMHREPRADDPLEQLVLAPLAAGRHEAGPGAYETVVDVGRHEGAPMLTFTAPHGAATAERTRPSPTYLATMARGLGESHGWDEHLAHEYLAGLQKLA
ncbi:hypothetical protein NOK12_15400 [Nocardioides sp. OK12]|uniref:Histone deacetylase n=1 Tax=Nocardioides marinisabuli TaxID=419476 RepID=A0A7Y9EYP0_9ACTN|nr:MULTISPECIES: histone deacetylase [Nocardioides]NYD56343.1 hypothetical protein [Nocardioides marinisabuli]GHJ59022.1 hypothetical protein NOK12_15400 [Nocardioides sp. OK12]